MTENPRYAGALVPRRLAAYAIDLAAVLVLAAAGFLLTREYLLPAVLAAEVLIVQVAWEGRAGCTLGQRLLGLRTVQLGSLRAPGLRRTLLRGLILLAGHLVVVGQVAMVASSAWDRSGHRQAWHDKATGVRVIDLHRTGAASTRSRFAPSGQHQHQQQQPEPVLAGAGAPAAAAGADWSVPPMPAQYAPAGGGAPAAQFAPQHYPPQAAPPQGYAAQPGMAGPHTAVQPGAVPPPAVQHAQVPPPPPVPPPPDELPEATSSGTAALDFTYAEPPEGFAEAVRTARAERAAEERAGEEEAGTSESVDAGPDAASAEAPSHRAPTPDSPAEHGVPDETQVPALRALLLETGESIDVLGGGYIGRAPRSPDDDAEAQLVAVPDPERSLSRTHARFGLVGGDLWLEDLGSANGTTVQLADGRQAHLTAHQRVALPVGTVVLLGTRRVTVTEGNHHTG